MATFRESLRHAWNAFNGTDLDDQKLVDAGEFSPGFYGRSPNRTFRFTNERSIVASIYTRIGIDVAMVDIKHVRLDDDGRFVEELDTGLNNCLKVEANIDQAATAFRLDIAQTLFDHGVAAIVPVDTTLSPAKTGGYDILTMRVGEVVRWYPQHVLVSLYNENKGKREELLLEKKYCAIIVNPLYAVMNEPNSTLKRLTSKLTLLDIVDEASSSGKLDLIIQLPYVVKTETRRQQAEQRAKDIEFQLRGSKHGIAYTDGSEKVIQLNRPVENTLLDQVKYLTEMLYNQLGLTEDIMNGTADEKAMLNYHNRTVGPILTAITEGMHRTFLTKTARTQKQAVKSFRDPFKHVPLADIVEMADKFTRNEIASSNEIRQVVGWKPSKDPKADELRNSNMPEPSAPENSTPTVNEEGDSQNGRR